MKILLVDHSRTICKIQKNVLAQLGYDEVLEANDGIEALTTLGEQPVDLVFVDWHLPQMDGVTLTRKIRETNADVPIIMCTTQAEESRVLDAFQAGANNYVVKPFTTHSIEAKIDETLAMFTDAVC